ncbi:MAG: ketopantoate reductase family protein, partial [Muribaculaceae bacterium]|nr:ketopantoate reductase family protein [Muribaculaceae bacterium]
MKRLKYLIVGTGGVGGSIAAFLTLAGKNVSCIARGESLKAIKQRGMIFHSDMKGDYPHLPVKAYSEEEYTDKADVIFVTV